jgi:competence protein ComEC
MSVKFQIPFWKTSPFLRLLLPLVTGILLQWYLQFAFLPVLIPGIIAVSIFIILQFLPLVYRFKLTILNGIIINVLLICLGMYISWQKDVRHSANWFGNYYHDSDYVVVRINEPVIEKTKSIKADGFVESIMHNGITKKHGGKLLLYFSKDSAARKLQYGDVILINKKLQAIKNSGNPGAFNYEQYATFQQTFFNVFLKPNDWVLLPQKNIHFFRQFIFSSREKILSILKKNVSSNKDQLGIAEALLIGYTNDLDKDLVQSYSNTGVVHIIAISGMHLGLIYVMLVWLFSKIPLVKKSVWMQVILILGCLWLFSLLTGASASVCRAAVMFTFITVGNSFARKSSIYNSLAASAFVMLCYNPFYLWDVGFQLSYLAVFGIVVFQIPIYNCFFIKNKWLDKVWKLAAISLAAQTLTFPICIYYFHQFPNFFLFTNIIAVPLSSIILYATIGLISLSWIPVIGIYLGKAINGMVWLMNHFILWVDSLPFTVWDRIPATYITTTLLYGVVIGAAIWLLTVNKNGFRLSLLCLLAFIIVHANNTWEIQNQQKLIVYNVPQHRAIDFIKGNSYQFVGDSVLLQDGMQQNFHLKPARIALQLNKPTDSLSVKLLNPKFCQFINKKIFMIDQSFIFDSIPKRIDIDYIIISKNAKLGIKQLADFFNCQLYVFDASNSMWKIDKWQKECEELHLRNFSIPKQGAFVSDIE